MSANVNFISFLCVSSPPLENPKHVRTHSHVSGNVTPTGGESMSEAGAAESSEEEELDDHSLGIKSNARANLRLSPRRKSASQQQPQQQQKNKGHGRCSSGGGGGGGGGETNTKRAGATAASGRRAKPQAEASAQGGSSSESSSSESSDGSSSSSESAASDTKAAARAAARGRTGRGGKSAASGFKRDKVKAKSKREAVVVRDGERQRSREGVDPERLKGKDDGRNGGVHTQRSDGRGEEEERRSQRPNQVCLASDEDVSLVAPCGVWACVRRVCERLWVMILVILIDE